MNDRLASRPRRRWSAEMRAAQSARMKKIGAGWSAEMRAAARAKAEAQWTAEMRAAQSARMRKIGAVRRAPVWSAEMRAAARARAEAQWTAEARAEARRQALASLAERRNFELEALRSAWRAADKVTRAVFLAEVIERARMGESENAPRLGQ